MAYNKMDVPEAADYWADIRAALLSNRGIAVQDCMAISAATGQGTQQLVRRLHAVLDALPSQVVFRYSRGDVPLSFSVCCCSV